ncbi:MAG: EAL domain-containing protein [Lachnospiraceae bacterium]|nr:EAL domain-containing protein [Lachnospiraceae bacterium]
MQDNRIPKVQDGQQPDPGLAELICGDEQIKNAMFAVLINGGAAPFLYFVRDDRLIAADEETHRMQEIPHYLKYLEKETRVHPEDRWKAIEYYKGRLDGPLELRKVEPDGSYSTAVLEAVRINSERYQQEILVGNARNITQGRIREESLELLAMQDAMTGVYNSAAGKSLIQDYLNHKNPYASCGMIVVDIDYLKSVNDNYGHLFGDRVITAMAGLLREIFAEKDIVLRAGGDEFVIFLKEVSHITLAKRAVELIQKVRGLTFPEHDYMLTCSAGVCFLPENISGYSYEQLFENADWALYHAKLNGRNRCFFCDNLRRFDMQPMESEGLHRDIDVRYLHNDIISTAFEIFERKNTFDSAITLLLEVIGTRFRLDRITVIQTNIKERKTRKQYCWSSSGTTDMLDMGGFSKEDFLTLFHSYDEYGTTVLQYDHMEMYSEAGRNLLVQGGAKTVVYAAMYCEGTYVGAISFVVSKDKRYWSKQDRRRFGELTKIISAHLAKSQAINSTYKGSMWTPEYDPLTGLLSFSRFREEVERVIVGNRAGSYVMVYSDFNDFKYFNKKYGYSTGNKLLIEFSNYIIGTMQDTTDVYFTRVVADQFILFMPYPHPETRAGLAVVELNDSFSQEICGRYPGVNFKVQTGIYFIEPDCVSASEAIDAADYARKQAKKKASVSVVVYNKELKEQRNLEMEVINGLKRGIENREFRIYLQPKFSMKDFSMTGAEALVRWEKPDGSVLTPADFIPIYERTGQILELDYYVYEEVARFLAKNQSLGRRQVPIAVNASILHASDEGAVERYLEILNRYGVDPSLTEIELTETATVQDYQNVRQLFLKLREAGIRTALDDFGAGYSVLNTIIDVPVDSVKLDRIFVDSCCKDGSRQFLLKQVIDTVQGLGYQVICEGIESEEQARLLRKAGCEEGQGFWFAKAMPVEECEKMWYYDMEGGIRRDENEAL